MDNIKNINIEIKNIEDTGKISGYGAIFNNIDLVKDKIQKGAFTKTLLEKDIKEIYFLRQHNRDVIIGEFNDIHEDENGLYVEGKFFLDTTAGKDAYRLAKKGVLNSFSIGYIAKDFGYEEIEGEEIRDLKSVELLEVSLVIMPANKLAKVTEIKSEVNEIIVDDKESEIKEFYDNAELKMDGYQIYNVVDNVAKLNFKAVEELPLDVKQKNKEQIQQFYRIFRKEFKDYTLMSEVCDLKELFGIWELKEFDKFLKSENKGLTNSELKVFYNRILELKTPKKTDDVEKNEKKHLPIDKGLVDLLLY